MMDGATAFSHEPPSCSDTPLAILRTINGSQYLTEAPYTVSLIFEKN